MKLTNPTDDELNAAFALELAGWKWAESAGNYLVDPVDGLIRNPPRWTESAGAVLPYLGETWDADADVGYVEVECIVPVLGKIQTGTGRSLSFPRAAVIALLRAHGVEIEFT